MPKDEGAPTVDELAVLAAVPRRVTVYTLDKETDAKITKSVRVAPMTLDVCGECAASLRPIAEALGLNIGIDQLPLIISDHHKSVRAIVARATEEDEKYIGTLPLDQFLKLATDVWEVNHAFFVHLVGPIAKSLAAKLYGGAGPTSSTSLPNTGTPTP
jgi:hypothetical protein